MAKGKKNAEYQRRLKQLEHEFETQDQKLPGKHAVKNARKRAKRRAERAAAAAFGGNRSSGGNAVGAASVERLVGAVNKLVGAKHPDAAMLVVPRSRQGGVNAGMRHPLASLEQALGGADAVKRAIAMMFSLPAVAPCVRLCVGVSGVPTACARPWSREALQFATAPAAGNGNQDELSGAVFRQLTRHTVTQYSIGAIGTAATLVGLADDTSGGAYYTADDDFWNVCQFSDTGPSGPVRYCLDHENVPFVWVECAGTAKFTFSTFNAALAPINMIAGLTLWQRQAFGGQITDTQVPWDAGTGPGFPTGTYTMSGAGFGSGYYAFRIDTTAGPFAAGTLLTVGIQETYPANSIIWKHQPVPGFTTNSSVVAAARMNAYSILLSNVGTTFAKRGSAVGCTIPQGEDWQSVMSAAPFNQAAPTGSYNRVNARQGSERFEAATGLYGFGVPSDVEALGFKRTGDLINGVRNIDLEPLYPDDSYLAWSMSIPLNVVAGGASVAEDRAFVMTLVDQLEYQTEDTWRETERTSLGPTVTLEAVQFAATLPQWHENKLHFAQLLRKITNVAGWAAPYLKAAGAIGGPYGAPLLAVGNVADAVGGLGQVF